MKIKSVLGNCIPNHPVILKYRYFGSYVEGLVNIGMLDVDEIVQSDITFLKINEL